MRYHLLVDPDNEVVAVAHFKENLSDLLGEGFRVVGARLRIISSLKGQSAEFVDKDGVCYPVSNYGVKNFAPRSLK